MIGIASVALAAVMALAASQNRRARRINPRTIQGLTNNVLGFVLAGAAMLTLCWWAVEAFKWLASPEGWRAAEWIAQQVGG